MSNSTNPVSAGKNLLHKFYHSHPIISNILMIGLVAVFIAFCGLFFLDIWTNHGRTTIVPEVRKKSFAEATLILDKSHLHYEIADSVYDTSVPPGTVKEIWPHPGTRVKPGRLIYLTVNSFQPQQVTISMPLTGVSSRQAMTYLESLNVKNVRIVYVPSNFADLVEGAKYKGKNIVPGMQIPVNANVVLEVGTVPEVTVPDISEEETNNQAEESMTEETSIYIPEVEIEKDTSKPENTKKKDPEPEVFD